MTKQRALATNFVGVLQPGILRVEILYAFFKVAILDTDGLEGADTLAGVDEHLKHGAIAEIITAFPEWLDILLNERGAFVDV